MNARSSEGYHAMKRNNKHSTPDKAAQSEVKMVMVDELQAIFYLTLRKLGPEQRKGALEELWRIVHHQVHANRVQVLGRRHRIKIEKTIVVRFQCFFFYVLIFNLLEYVVDAMLAI
jgi:hypothetical protein